MDYEAKALVFLMVLLAVCAAVLWFDTNGLGDIQNPAHNVTGTVYAKTIDTHMSAGGCYDVVVDDSTYYANLSIGNALETGRAYTFHVTNHYNNNLLWIDNVSP